VEDYLLFWVGLRKMIDELLLTLNWWHT